MQSKIPSLDEKLIKVQEEISTLVEAVRIESEEICRLKLLLKPNPADTHNTNHNYNLIIGTSEIFTNINEFLENQSKQHIEFIVNVNIMKLQLEKKTMMRLWM